MRRRARNRSAGKLHTDAAKVKALALQTHADLISSPLSWSPFHSNHAVRLVASSLISDPLTSVGVLARPTAVKYRGLQTRTYADCKHCQPASILPDSV
jgi:hypothetical protein